jgi:hypothetical protein
MAKLSDARRSLERARDAAKARLVELEDARRGVKASLKSLDNALKALGESKMVPRSKPAATQAEVAATATELLTADGPMSVDKLVSRISDRLLKNGNSTAGVKLRLMQVLNNKPFLVDGEKCSVDWPRTDAPKPNQSEE